MQYTIKLPLSNFGGFTNSSLSAAHEFLEIQMEDQELKEFFTHYSESTSSPHARTLFQSKVDAKLCELLAKRRSSAAPVPATDSEAVSSDEFNVSGLGSQPDSSCTSGASDADASGDDKVVPEPVETSKKPSKASKRKRQKRKSFKKSKASGSASPVKDGAQKSKRMAALGRKVVPRGTKAPQVEDVEEVDFEIGLNESRESRKTELAAVMKQLVSKVPFGPEEAKEVVLPPIEALDTLKAKLWFKLFSNQPVDRPFKVKARTIRSWFNPSVFEPFMKPASVQKAIEGPKNTKQIFTVHGPSEKILKKIEGSSKVDQVLAFHKAQYFYSKRILSFENLFSQYKVNWPKATKSLDLKALPVPHTNNNLQVGQLSQYHEFMRLLKLSELSNPFRECLPLPGDKDELPLKSSLPPPSAPKIVEVKDDNGPSKRALKQRAKRQSKKEKKKKAKATKKAPRQFKSTTNSTARRERRQNAQRNTEFDITPPPRPQKIELTPVSPVVEEALTLPVPVIEEPVNHLQVGQVSQYHYFMKLLKLSEEYHAYKYASQIAKVLRATKLPLFIISTVKDEEKQVEEVTETQPEEQVIYPIQSTLKLIEWVKEEKEECIKGEEQKSEPKKVKKTPVSKPKTSKAKQKRKRNQKAKRSKW